jgi:hypothetical protein
MSANDGHVVGVVKPVDNGPDTERWNLVIVGDGYQEGELAQYHVHTQHFVDRLRSTAPFSEEFGGINVYRIDVVSLESGADDPGCAGGPVVIAKTYFDATFCSSFHGEMLDRLLTVDEALVLSVSNDHVPRKHYAVCIVNSPTYGGSGGSIATCSVHAQSATIAIHELGHTAFGLDDEYGGNEDDIPPGEPAKPNVTRDTNRATNKWRALVAASTPMPTQCNPACVGSGCVAPPAPPPPAAVGTYEGAMGKDCGVYRPMMSCYMRELGRPFCLVCAGVIRETLQDFQP